ncbi:MAG: ribonuclease Y [Bdellovibrionota bacterium]
MDTSTAIVIVAVGLFFGLIGIGFFFNKKQLAAAFETAQAESKAILEEARKEADNIVKEAMQDAKNDARKKRKAFEDEAKKRRSEISKLEAKLKKREQTLEKRLESIDKKENEIEVTQKRLANAEKRHHRLIAECEVMIENNQKTLEKVANMSVEEAKQELTKSLEETARKEAQETIRKLEQETRKESVAKAQAIISLAVQRTAGNYVNDSTITVVALPSEEMKGRIIGREGRNIRAIEQATGVDLIIDDTPEAVIISCFNPVRREMAKITLEHLIADGRIHPARIEETAKRIEADFESLLKENGEQAAFDVGITDLHPEILSHLGRLKYRTAGMQTVLQHSVETAHICGMLASELNLKTRNAKRAGLLHDIGKAVNQETEGSHWEIGASLCEKYGEHESIVEAIKLHHEDDLDFASPLAVIVNAANKLSSSRPGARKEVMETFVKRLSDMEAIVNSFEGIDSAYVLQAGREIRALVSPEGVDDQEVTDLSSDIAVKLRNELSFLDKSALPFYAKADMWITPSD